MEKPTTQEWKQLYEAASKFKQSQCWTWMHDDDNFAVEDVQTEQVAYCSIMGKAGQLVGIVAYLGSEGLSNLTELLLHTEHGEDFRYTQKCLMFSYGDREELEAEELRVIKALKLKFRGRGQWPKFQDYSPGKLPWQLTGFQCRLFTQIIEQAVEVANRCKTEKDLLTNYPHEPKMFFRVKSKEGTWRDEYKEVSATRNYRSFAIRDELLLKKLKKLHGKPGGIIEVETFYCPMPVVEQKGDRPIFPKMCLFVDHRTGMVLGYRSFIDFTEEAPQCLDGLIELIGQLGAIPLQMLVRKEETYYLFQDVCKQLEIELVRVSELESIEEVKAELFEFMG